MAAVEILLILFDCGAFLIADMIEAPEQTLDDSVSLSQHKGLKKDLETPVHKKSNTNTHTTYQEKWSRWPFINSLDRAEL